jgi:intermediate cleaving peptidase 55
MVITIEPGTCKPLAPSTRVLTLLLFSIGVYVPADPQFPKHFHGFGMRIEDEVLVGAEHPVVLSASAPKEVCCRIAFCLTD